MQLDDEKYEQWLEQLGFSCSYALMCRIGSRSGALQLMMSFALSGKGIVEARHIDPKDPGYEDYDVDLAEEGIDLKDYFVVQATYLHHPDRRGSAQSIFDPFYCRKAA